MKLVRLAALALAGLALLALPCSAADAEGEPKPIPDKPESEQFPDAPAPWRDYLVQARAAERLGDPLQRCLAYPDLPGNRWPEGHAEAHCRLHAIQVIDLAGIDAYLERGGIEALDALMAGYLRKHFEAPEFGEDIHDAINRFSDATNTEADRISTRWLSLAPKSAYANAARASYLLDAAWNARGNKFAASTPRESMRKMGELVAQSIPLYEEALRIEPRLMPAYVGLLDLAMTDSRHELERAVIARAREHDPACISMARQMMTALEPRWGGSYEEMLSLAAQLSPLVGDRPLLAMHVGSPYGDRGDRLRAQEQYTKEAMDILAIALRTGSNEEHMRDAAIVAINLVAADGGPQHWYALAALLQEARFREGSAWADRQIAWYLVREEPEWGLRHALRAVEREPESGFGQYMLAAAYYNTGQYDAAERHYLAAAEDEAQRMGALGELAEMRLFEPGVDRKQAASNAKPFIDRLLEAYPTDGIGWMLRLDQEEASMGAMYAESIEAFLRHADRSDPRQAEAARLLEVGPPEPIPGDSR